MPPGLERSFTYSDQHQHDCDVSAVALDECYDEGLGADVMLVSARIVHSRRSSHTLHTPESLQVRLK